MKYRRRTFLTEPGEPLILARSALDIVDRYSQFTAMTGLDQQYIAASPLVSIPLPMLSRQAGPRGWPVDINPGALWHPLFWLPERVAMRYRFDDEAGDEAIESEGEWAVRVAIETTLSDLYDPGDATWLDVLSMVELDSEDFAVQERIVSWLAGDDDAALDSIDLTEMLEHQENPHWAADVTGGLMETLQAASWAVLADDLAKSADEVALDAVTIEEARAQTITLANLALGVIGQVPPAAPDQQPPAELWSEIARSTPLFNGNLTQLLEGNLTNLGESFYGIRDDYWMFVESLDEVAAANAPGELAIA